MPSQSAQNHHGDELCSKATATASTEESAQQMCKHTRSSNNCRQLLADSFGCGQKVWRPLCHGSWTMKQLGYGSAGRHAHDEKKDDGPQVAEVGPKVAEFAARQGQSSPQKSQVSVRSRRSCSIASCGVFSAFQGKASPVLRKVEWASGRSSSIVNLSQSGSSIVLRVFVIEFIRSITFFLEFIHCISLIVLSFFLSLFNVLPFFMSLSIVLPFFMSLSIVLSFSLRCSSCVASSCCGTYYPGKKIIKAETFMRLIHRGATSWISRL